MRKYGPFLSFPSLMNIFPRIAPTLPRVWLHGTKTALCVAQNPAARTCDPIRPVGRLPKQRHLLAALLVFMQERKYKFVMVAAAVTDSGGF